MNGEPLTVIHIDTGKEMRGGQWQVLSLMQGLRNHGVEQFLVSPKDAPLTHHIRERGFAWQPNLGGQWSRGRRAGIVHAHDARAHTQGWLKHLPRLVVARRVAFPIKTNFLSRWKYQWPQRYIAVSEHVRQCLVAAGVEPQRIHVVYDGVDPLPPAHAYKFLAIDFKDPAKRSDLIREAAALANVEVHFTHNLPCDLAEARAFLYITDSEGLGSAILLAQSSGVPVIASNVGGIPEIVRQGETGFLVDNNAPSIAAALLAIKDTQRAQDMAAAARAEVLARFTTQRMVDATLAVYRGMPDA
jgi:glycosyltransferase involved in cell wall biosynthesis